MSIRRLKSRGIGRLELLAWLNELLETDYTKIEHLADGIAYCQVLDALHPGKVSLTSVRFHAKSHADYEANFRILQRSFHACGIHKEIPLNKLVDGVFQEHYEFLHWIHDYAHKTYPDALRKYKGYARRQQVLGTRDSANMNLVPSYVASTKETSHLGYLSSDRVSLALDLIDLEEVPADVTLNDLIGETNTSDNTDDNSGATPQATPPLEEPHDPLLRYVTHSHEATNDALRILTQLEKTMEIVLDDPVKKQSRPGHATSANPAIRKGSVSSKAAKTSTMPPSSSDPPFLRPQLEHLIEALGSELIGRAKDLNHLDEEVNGLLKALQLSQAATDPEPSKTEPT